MTIHTTPLYGLAYADTDTAVIDLATVSQQLAQTVEAALNTGGVAAPGAADVTAVAARVTALEQWRPKANDVAFTQGGINTDWAGTAYGWVAGLGAKLTVPADGRVRSWAAVLASNYNRTVGLRYRLDLAAGPGKAATTTYFPNATGFIYTAPAGSELSATFQAGGQLLGDQAATLYLEARVVTAGAGSVIIPTVTLQTSTD